MIKSIEFSNYRNLNKKFQFDEKLNVIFGNNNSGKTNLLDGLRLAFSTITNDYFKISKSDFKNSDDTIPINIKVELEKNSIPSLNFFDENGTSTCGFSVLIKKSQNGRYVRDVSLLNGSSIDFEILKFIYKNTSIDVLEFYEKLRKNYNNKKSSLYINIMKEEN